MSFPTTSVLDTFDRANEGPPPSADWTNDWIYGGGGIAVVSNQAVPPGTARDDWWDASTFGPDAECYLTFATASGTLGLGVRLITPNANLATTDGYMLSQSSTSFGVLQRIDNGAQTQLGASFGGAAVSGEKFGIEAVGTTIAAYKDSGSGWASLDSRTDSTYSAAGYIGIAFTASGTAGNDFGGGTVVTPVVSLISDTPPVIGGFGAT